MKKKRINNKIPKHIEKYLKYIIDYWQLIIVFFLIIGIIPQFFILLYYNLLSFFSYNEVIKTGIITIPFLSISFFAYILSIKNKINLFFNISILLSIILLGIILNCVNSALFDLTMIFFIGFIIGLYQKIFYNNSNPNINFIFFIILFYLGYSLIILTSYYKYIYYNNDKVLYINQEYIIGEKNIYKNNKKIILEKRKKDKTKPCKILKNIFK